MQLFCGKCKEEKTLDPVTKVRLNVSHKKVLTKNDDGTTSETLRPKVQPNVRLYRGECETCHSKLNRIHSVVPEYEHLFAEEVSELEESVRNEWQEKEKANADKPKKVYTPEQIEIRKSRKAAKKAEKKAASETQKAAAEKEKAAELIKKRKASEDSSDAPEAKKRKSSPKPSIESLLTPAQFVLLGELQDDLKEASGKGSQAVEDGITIVSLIENGFDVYIHVPKSAIVNVSSFLKNQTK
ncbi:biopolymer transport protein TolA [Planoprotostelium fungivorum]|uniref:Biopolymer transport protein TolA n=1 Tax=Planoprotostelium fungivorum TaxID=1890364 RepID=A0A2P6NQM9_9EUKA|nr:biopolymer transport protein TolA [Planoprotostelium fungivorum]